jgi:hypothetical protein
MEFKRAKEHPSQSNPLSFAFALLFPYPDDTMLIWGLHYMLRAVSLMFNLSSIIKK